MDFEDDKILISLFRSQLEKEEREAWDDIYGSSNCDDYDSYIDCQDYEYSNINPIRRKAYDWGGIDYPSSFVSIDFENLYPQRVSVCSVGMVKYKNGVIVDRYYSLIRPPFNYEGKKGPALTWIHGFTEDMLKNERTFDEILPEMEAFVDNLPMVAHNACVEIACIHDACAYYNVVTSMPYEEMMDTYPISEYVEESLGLNICGSGTHSLNVVCKRFGVSELRHHHACDDAEMCGNLFLAFPKFLSGELKIDESVLNCMSTNNKKHDSSKGNAIYGAFESQGHKNLCGNVLQKDLSCADPNNPFYDRKVVITGVFSIDREELADRLKSMGADIDKGVGKKTNFLLIGEDPGPSKIKKFDDLIAEGKNVRKIYQEDLDLILAGKEYDKYHIDLPISEPKKKKQ